MTTTSTQNATPPGPQPTSFLTTPSPVDAIFFHIPQIRVPYEFFLPSSSGLSKDSRAGGQSSPEILYPHYAAALDYQDFRHKLSADAVRATAPSHPRVWVMLMYNGPKLPDPTNVMLTQVLPEFFPKEQRWQFPMVEYASTRSNND